MSARSGRGRFGRSARLPLLAATVLAAFAVFGPGQALAQDVTVQKTDSPDPVTRGNVLTYQLIVRNIDPVTPATNVMAVDELPNNVTFLSATTNEGDPCVRQGKTVTCSLGTIPPLGTEVVTIRVRPTKTGILTNVGRVSAAVETNVNNNRDTETTRVVRRPTGPACAGVAATKVGTPGNDYIVGTSRRDVILGLAGDDVIIGLDGRDVLCGNRGFDIIGAGALGDRVIGGPGADVIFGRSGGDVLRGAGGLDRLRGGSGNDGLRGNRGNDRLFGGAGGDGLKGGRGFDRCRGGPGRDVRRTCER